MSGLQLRRWLRLGGSLSAHLQSLGARFEVQRLSQRVDRLLPGERQSLGVRHGTRCVVREVVLRVDGRPLVFARSVAQARTLNGPWRSLGGLGSQPLAQLLFDAPQVSRSVLCRLRLPGAGPWGRLLADRWRVATGHAWREPVAWGRHSVFCKAGMALRVTEIFAPEMQAIRPPQNRRRQQAADRLAAVDLLRPPARSAAASR